MAVIAFGSSKGGVGKTTSTIILGTELARMGKNVTFIDGDKLTRSLTRWRKIASIPDNINFINNVSENTIAQHIKSQNKNGTVVIVDLPGVVSRLTSNAMAQTDLFIVPMADSSIDAMVGADALTLVKREEKRLRRQIRHAVVITQTGYIVSKEERRIREALNPHAVDIIDPNLSKRAAFSSLFFHGGTLHDKTPGVESMADENGLEEAKANAEAFARSVYERLPNGTYHD